MEKLTERYKGQVFCKADCSKIGYTDDCECPHLQKMKEKLAHYEDLEEQGRLIVLPCKVGDVVYGISKVRKLISEYRIISIEIYNHSIFFNWKCESGIYNRIDGFMDDAIGEEVFLTKSEAEKALAEMEK